MSNIFNAPESLQSGVIDLNHAIKIKRIIWKFKALYDFMTHSINILIGFPYTQGCRVGVRVARSWWFLGRVGVLTL